MHEMLYFTADWCQPCKQMKPKVQKLADDAGKTMRVINIDSDYKVAAAYGVKTVPTVVFMKSGVKIEPAKMPWPTVKEIIQDQLSY